MGKLHIGDTRRDGRNPRGWFVSTHDPKFPAATDPEYQERFREAMLENAEKVVRSCRQMGVQGVVVWQVGGMQEPGHSYYGEPRILPYVAPEMDAVADDYFRVLREGGGCDRVQSGAQSSALQCMPTGRGGADRAERHADVESS